LRKAFAAIAAVPAIAGIYLQVVRRRRPRAVRVVAATLVLALAGLVAVEISAPPATTAYRTAPVDPEAIARVAAPIVSDYGLHQAVQLDFSVPMDRASVEAALAVQPAIPVTVSWNAAGTNASVVASAGWTTGTFYTVTVGTMARSATGRALSSATRAIILTRSAPTATIAATAVSGKRAQPTSGFSIAFSRQVDVASLRAALRITPAVKGSLTADLPGRADRFTFLPSGQLAANTVYVVTFAAPVLDTSGIPVEKVPRLVVRTLDEATVVRFRPVGHAQAVDPSAAVSVRFSRAMDRASTQAAFRLSGVDTKKGGTFSWAEGDTVLVFQPSRPLDYSRAYVMVVTEAARSREGVPLVTAAGAQDVRSAFRVAPRPKPAPVPTPVATVTAPGTVSIVKPAPVQTPAPSGALWASDESFALGLLNCTRTGGWVQSDGSCSGYGSGKYSAYVAPLTLSTAISSRVTRPYAELLADNRTCSHFYDGNPGTRLARGGFSSWHWAENIGCQSGNPRQVAINSALFFQDEKPTGGGHWVNLKNPAYSEVGIGIWSSEGYVLVVYDFYHP
jgi:hypothetical protein